jgi:hypothetical protein
MKLLGLVNDAASIARTLAAEGEVAEVSCRSPGRGPPYWKSRVLRLKKKGAPVIEAVAPKGAGFSRP